jgi:uncharacterized protein (TIGR03435 family)
VIRWLCFLLAFAVTGAQTVPEFDSASIRPADGGDRGTCGRYQSGERFNTVNCPLLYIIEGVYGLREWQVPDIPKWLQDEKSSSYTISARAREAVSNSELHRMSENLLADHFQLKFHREKRKLSIYALMPVKDGSRLHLSANDGTPRGSGGVDIFGPAWLSGTNVSIDHLIEVLYSRVDRPVIDKTGIEAPIDFTLRWAPENTPNTELPSLFTAMEEQLGLKMESQKLPVEVFVIDHVERPSRN